MKNIANNDTIETTPVTYAPTAATYNTSDLPPGLKVPNSPYSLINRNFTTSSISTKKTSKRKKKKIDDKVTFYYPRAPEYFYTSNPKDSYRYPVWTLSNSPYSLRNCNFYATSTTT